MPKKSNNKLDGSGTATRAVPCVTDVALTVTNYSVSWKGKAAVADELLNEVVPIIADAVHDHRPPGDVNIRRNVRTIELGDRDEETGVRLLLFAALAALGGQGGVGNGQDARADR